MQLFEVTIRVLGSLLSAHVIARDGLFGMAGVVDEDETARLLGMAYELGSRLLPAFDETRTGIPHPRVNLKRGLLLGTSPLENKTCLAGGGTLILEFGMLSRLTGDPVFESRARRALLALWDRRSAVTGLLGNEIDVQTGVWTNPHSGLGAGMDSFFETLLKAYVLFGREEYRWMFVTAYESIQEHHRHLEPPLYANVDMNSASVINQWIDSLQASFAAVQALHGDLREAVHQHSLFYGVWDRYGALPERFNWQLKASEVHFYPLRPELMESTYSLYRATGGDPHFSRVGEALLDDLDAHARTKCGFATLHHVESKEQEDRMEVSDTGRGCKWAN